MKKMFCKKLKEAIYDEKKAPIDYAKLKKLAPTSYEKKKINSIMKDERRHRDMLLDMRERLHKKHEHGESKSYEMHEHAGHMRHSQSRRIK